jgi:hypothetical protein
MNGFFNSSFLTAEGLPARRRRSYGAGARRHGTSSFFIPFLVHQPLTTESVLKANSEWPMASSILNSSYLYLSTDL